MTGRGLPEQSQIWFHANGKVSAQTVVVLNEQKTPKRVRENNRIASCNRRKTLVRRVDNQLVYSGYNILKIEISSSSVNGVLVWSCTNLHHIFSGEVWTKMSDDPRCCSIMSPSLSSHWSFTSCLIEQKFLPKKSLIHYFLSHLRFSSN